MNGLTLALRVLLSLGAVLGLFLLAARGGRKRLGGMRGKADLLEIVTRQGLGRNASVVVVRAAGRGLVLGVTETTISLLTEVDVAELVLEEAPEARPAPEQNPNEVAGTSPGWTMVRPTAWRNALDSMREMTVRRA